MNLKAIRGTERGLYILRSLVAPRELKVSATLTISNIHHIFTLYLKGKVEVVVQAPGL